VRLVVPPVGGRRRHKTKAGNPIPDFPPSQVSPISTRCESCATIAPWRTRRCTRCPSWLRETTLPPRPDDGCVDRGRRRRARWPRGAAPRPTLPPGSAASPRRRGGLAVDRDAVARLPRPARRHSGSIATHSDRFEPLTRAAAPARRLPCMGALSTVPFLADAQPAGHHQCREVSARPFLDIAPAAAPEFRFSRDATVSVLRAQVIQVAARVLLREPARSIHARGLP
jgi:hypothetical protein